MNDTTKIVSALLAGFAAGAAAGILFAPEKGSDLRSKISETAKDWSDTLAELANSGAASVSDIKERVEEKSEKAGNNNSGKKTTDESSSQKRHV